jgi:chorismate mutase
LFSSQTKIILSVNFLKLLYIISHSLYYQFIAYPPHVYNAYAVVLRQLVAQLRYEYMQALAKRMRVAREIGTYKKEHDMTILQTGRYNEILEKRGSQGALCGMDAEFIKKVFEAIHEESVRQQMEIINK